MNGGDFSLVQGESTSVSERIQPRTSKLVVSILLYILNFPVSYLLNFVEYFLKMLDDPFDNQPNPFESVPNLSIMNRTNASSELDSI